MGSASAGGAGASSGKGKGKGKKDAWEAVSILLRIATVGMSLAQAVTTLASTQCAASSSQVDDAGAGAAASSSCGYYGSFTYSSVANLLSALLQGVVICLEVVGEEKWVKTVELIDKAVLALTSTSGPLLLAADDITSCGPPRGRGRNNNNNNNNGARGQQPKLLDGKVQLFFSLGPLLPAAGNEVVKQKIKQYQEVKSAAPDDSNTTRPLDPVVPVSATVPPPAPPVPTPPPAEALAPAEGLMEAEVEAPSPPPVQLHPPPPPVYSGIVPDEGSIQRDGRNRSRNGGQREPRPRHWFWLDFVPSNSLGVPWRWGILDFFRRRRTPTVPINFFRRLPARTDAMI